MVLGSSPVAVTSPSESKSGPLYCPSEYLFIYFQFFYLFIYFFLIQGLRLRKIMCWWQLLLWNMFLSVKTCGDGVKESIKTRMWLWRFYLFKASYNIKFSVFTVIFSVCIVAPCCCGDFISCAFKKVPRVSFNARSSTSFMCILLSSWVHVPPVFIPSQT